MNQPKEVQAAGTLRARQVGENHHPVNQFPQSIMALIFRVFGTESVLPASTEVDDFLRDTAEIEAVVELDEDEDPGDWTHLYVYGEDSEGSVSIVVQSDEDEFESDRGAFIEILSDLEPQDEIKTVLDFLDAAVTEYLIEVPDGFEDDEFVLTIASYVAQFFAQQSGGFYALDQEAFFDDSGELICSVAMDEDEGEEGGED